MGPVEALRLALSKEVEAIQMYTKFSADYPAAKDVFVFLRGEEYKHKKLIEKKNNGFFLAKEPMLIRRDEKWPGKG